MRRKYKNMDKFMGGFLIGIFVTSIIAISSFGGQKTITTKTKIKPEWQLVTDGKTVDTVYIYTEK